MLKNNIQQFCPRSRNVAAFAGPQMTRGSSFMWLSAKRGSLPVDANSMLEVGVEPDERAHPTLPKTRTASLDTAVQPPEKQ